MRYRNFGNTKLRISEIGFGSWGIGKITRKTPGYYGANDKDSVYALKEAYDNGINFYDTSNIYGNGHSEKLIGKTFQKKREKIIISTKGGCLPHKTLIMPQNFEKKFLLQELNKSLKRLKTDYVDCYLLHSPKYEDIEKFSILETLEKLKKNGKIRFYGISCRTPDDGYKFINNYKFDCLQVNFNLIDQRIIDNKLINLAKKKNLGIIARTPLVFGFLTKKVHSLTNFKRLDDHRSNFSKDLRKKWENATKFYEKFYKKYNCTPAQFAIKFCLDFNQISTVIPGMIKRDEVLENIKASSVKGISLQDHNLIRNIYLKKFNNQIIEILKNKRV